jgi:hypothetical protein
MVTRPTPIVPLPLGSATRHENENGRALRERDLRATLGVRLLHGRKLAERERHEDPGERNRRPKRRIDDL